MGYRLISPQGKVSQQPWNVAITRHTRGTQCLGLGGGWRAIQENSRENRKLKQKASVPVLRDNVVCRGSNVELAQCMAAYCFRRHDYRRLAPLQHARSDYQRFWVPRELAPSPGTGALDGVLGRQLRWLWRDSIPAGPEPAVFPSVAAHGVQRASSAATTAARARKSQKEMCLRCGAGLCSTTAARWHQSGVPGTAGWPSGPAWGSSSGLGCAASVHLRLDCEAAVGLGRDPARGRNLCSQRKEKGGIKVACCGGATSGCWALPEHGPASCLPATCAHYA
jgi:hypothetical protein